MASIEFGDLNPAEVIQEDVKACLSACILSLTPPDAEYTEKDINDILIDDGLYVEGIGTSLYPANHLNVSLRKLGLKASEIYEARIAAQDIGTEEQHVAARLAKIEKTLREGQKAILAFPKRREGQAPFLHYVVVSGYTEREEGNGVVIMDPSEIDGGVKRPTWEELQDYVTPEEGMPVMAWGIRDTEGTQDAKPIRNGYDEGLPGVSLLIKPLCNPEDRGESIPPGTEHPSSVAMPDYETTRQFAEIGDIVLSRDGEHATGYPRFVVPPQIKALAIKEWGRLDNLPFPSYASAKAAAGLEDVYGHGVAVTDRNGLFWLPDTNLTSHGWQHTGLGISSRQAQAWLEGRCENDLERRDIAEQKIKSIIEAHTGAKPEDIYLFPTGMAAVYIINQALIKMFPERPGVQFGFPYTDTYEQRKFGPHKDVRKNLIDIRTGDYEALSDILRAGVKPRGLVTEYPSNPLLWTPDFGRLDEMLVGDEVPVIVDDTVATMYNLDDRKLPDVVAARVTSLTKFFSSAGNVMGGSIVLRPESPYYDRLKAAVDSIYEDTLWYEDAETLAQNGNYFASFMPVINQNSSELAQWLNEEWAERNGALEAVFYPELSGKEQYDAVKKSGGGYSGLMSLRFKDPARAFRFFDELKVTKGPSLGTFYTLGCLYTLLAHKPVDTVKKFGVNEDLVRLSIGIEGEEDLKSRLQDAMEASAF